MRGLLLCVMLLSLYSCNKKAGDLYPVNAARPDTDGFIKYTIKAGAHYADPHAYRPADLNALHFRVRFDSSAVYQSARPENQYDINKLYGFSDNGMEHHQCSARFGWRWSDGALRLFAYVYNAGKMVSEELGVVPVGTEIRCSIKVEATDYVFSCGETVRTLPRQSTTPTGKGYLLYPYFGGDEAAPHQIAVWIKNE